MARFNRQNIDRKINKPSLKRSESIIPDPIFNRANETRRDNDVVKTPKRTVYDIDYAIKWFLENEIQPQVKANGELIEVPIIYSNGEKWDNVRRLGYIRDQKGMLQSPLIMIKRNSLQERDQLKKLDVNKNVSGNQIVYKQKYNKRNRYTDNMFPVPPLVTPAESKELFAVNVPEYVDIEYELLIWTDFTTQMNELVEQIMPYGTFAWGNEFNKYRTFIRNLNFETVNTAGEDRLVRCTMPLTVNGTLMAEQEYRKSTVEKRYSLKQISFAQVIDIGSNIFSTTVVPQKILNAKQQVLSGGSLVLTGATAAGGSVKVDADAMLYLTKLTDRFGTFSNTNSITVNAGAAINPTIEQTATKNEFNLYINGQYIDKHMYNWTPSSNGPQTIIFNIAQLGYELETTDTITINGRWS